VRPGEGQAAQAGWTKVVAYLCGSGLFLAAAVPAGHVMRTSQWRSQRRFLHHAGDDGGHDLADGFGLWQGAIPAGEQQVPGPDQVGASASTSASAAMRPSSRSAAR
jgi:hypothetical protein